VKLKREDGTILSSVDVQSVIAGSPNAGTQLVANEPDASGITYTRTEPVRETVVEYLRFNMSDAAPGRHVLIVTVDDLVANRTMSRSVSVRILPPSLQDRSARGVSAPGMSGFTLADQPPMWRQRRAPPPRR
jgi:hypothetical protein